MPVRKPIVSYSQIRNYAEKWSWIDPASRQSFTGFNPPANAIEKRRVPFNITFLTEDAVAYQGQAICVGVNTNRQTRRIQFVSEAHIVCSGCDTSILKKIPIGEIRQVSDLLIVEIDGVRFSVH